MIATMPFRRRREREQKGFLYPYKMRRAELKRATNLCECRQNANEQTYHGFYSYAGRDRRFVIFVIRLFLYRSSTGIVGRSIKRSVCPPGVPTVNCLVDPCLVRSKKNITLEQILRFRFSCQNVLGIRQPYVIRIIVVVVTLFGWQHVENQPNAKWNRNVHQVSKKCNAWKILVKWVFARTHSSLSWNFD